MDESKRTLDDIIDDYEINFERAQELYDHYGGCICNATEHPPCGFCEEYDWEEDPLNLQ